MIPNLLSAQSMSNCKFDELHQRKLQNNHQYKKRSEQLDQKIYARMRSKNESAESNAIHVIPVVVHVNHLGEAIGTGSNISDSLIMAGIQHLNDAFRNVGAYAGGPYYSNSDVSSMDVEIEFCLAVRDPSGSPSTGITRINTPYANLDPTGICDPAINFQFQDDCMKALSYWPSTDYMNVYLVNSIVGASGYAYLSASHGELFDGIVLRADLWGTSTDNSKAIVHETGHYLNLLHTFQWGCTETDCLLGGDRVCDTPPDNSNSNANCSTTVNSCSNDSLITNSPYTTNVQDIYECYMDYGNFACQNTFTPDQVTRMRIALTTDRVSLLSSAGCTPSTTIVTDFEVDTTSCLGNTIFFQDRSSYSFTTWNWSFPGGTPSSSTEKNPTVVYNSLGDYDVTLEAYNNQDTGTITKTDFIHIFDSPLSNCTINVAENLNYGSFKVGLREIELAQINNVVEGTIAQQMTYTDFSCTDIAFLETDSTYAFVAKIGLQNYEDVRVYIDFNNDGDFTDVGETIISVDSVIGDVPIQYFTAPTSPVQDTILRMRIISDLFFFNINPCSKSFYGHVEDYGIYFSSQNSPQSYFIADTTSGCDGLTVTFQDISTNQPTSWSWSFPGGTPAVSTEEHPTVVYPSTGLFDVSLTASNTHGAGTLATKVGFIEIFDKDGDGVSDCVDNCLDVSNPSQTNTDGDNFGDACDCNINDPTDEHLVINDNPIGNSTYLTNSSITSQGTVDINQTVIFQAKDSIVLEVGFVAIAGSDFIAKIDTCINNAVPINSPSPNETTLKHFSNPNASMQIFPNPFEFNTNILLQLNKPEIGTIAVYDILGNLLEVILENKYLEAGSHEVIIEGKNWQPGLYLVVFHTSSENIVRKMMRVE